MSKKLIIFGDFTAEEIEEIIEEFDINEEVNENKRNLSDFVFRAHLKNLQILKRELSI